MEAEADNNNTRLIPEDTKVGKKLPRCAAFTRTPVRTSSASVASEDAICPSSAAEAAVDVMRRCCCSLSSSIVASV